MMPPSWLESICRIEKPPSLENWCNSTPCSTKPMTKGDKMSIGDTRWEEPPVPILWQCTFARSRNKHILCYKGGEKSSCEQKCKVVTSETWQVGQMAFGKLSGPQYGFYVISWACNNSIFPNFESGGEKWQWVRSSVVPHFCNPNSPPPFIVLLLENQLKTHPITSI